MKSFTFLASAFLLFFTSLLILGVVSGSEYDVVASTTIEAPQVVVLKELIDFNNYYKWCPNILKSEYNPETQFRESLYVMDKRPVSIHEKVQVILSENIILFTEHNNKARGYIQNITNAIHLKENSDGTTEVSWEMSYTLKPMLSKILNIFAVKPALNRMLVENLNGLKKNIER
ncbi:MAG: SRPBCC family protein [Calditrichaceae bacterium]|nr:SRPBCC family protein [Calditrichaceae bacterium]